MVSIRGNPQGGSLNAMISSLLDRGYNRQAATVLRAVARSTNSGLIAQRIDEVNQEAQRLIDRGEALRADNPVLRALLADLEVTMRNNAALLDGAAPDLQVAAIEAAGKIQRQMSLGGMTDAQLRAAGVQWNRPDPEAMVRAIDYTESSAWREALEAYGERVVGVVQNQALRGIALGWNPLRTASHIKTMVEGFPAHEANTLMRTLQLTAYRDGTAIQQNANIGLYTQVIRVAALQAGRTCLACIALHGTVIWDSEINAGQAIPRVNDHHNGRCTSIAVVKGQSLNVRTGGEWYANLPENEKRVAAGEANYAALTDGKVTLREFAQRYDDPVFGEMVREASLVGILGEGARKYYG